MDGEDDEHNFLSLDEFSGIEDNEDYIGLEYDDYFDLEN